MYILSLRMKMIYTEREKYINSERVKIKNRHRAIHLLVMFIYILPVKTTLGM